MMGSVKALRAFAISVIAAFFVGCCNKPSALVGQWVYGSGDNSIENMELYKDGTGLLDGKTVQWKVENKHFVILSSLYGFSCDYEISGYELVLYGYRNRTTFVKREKVWEFEAKQTVIAEAERLRQAAEKVKEYTEQAKQNKRQIEQILEQYFVSVEGGTFTMGCTSEQDGYCEDNEKPAHSVTVSDFFIGKYEVTQKLWRAVMGNNPSDFRGDDLPVESVSWDDVQIFISVLNSLTGKNYRLPTEAEWEYAARGGNKSHGYIYSGGNKLGEVGWYGNNSGRKTRPVGQKKPNELGIYDMSGNVYEWCSDRYGSYPKVAVTNPTGPGTGDDRVLRGGGWYYYAQYCRVAYRDIYYPSGNTGNLGFRVAFSE